jgi:hypothetical protein
MDADGRLRIYLNDHLPASVVGREIASRVVARDRGSALGAFLAGYMADAAREREMLLAVMRRVGATRQPYKEVAARVAERIGRLKPNGQLRGHSPLSRLIEIESLLALLRASRSVWLALEALDDPRLAGLDLRERLLRATAEAEELERIGIDAAPAALGEPRPGPAAPG